MYTYTQNRITHHEDCPARSLHPWKRWGNKGGNPASFLVLVVSDLTGSGVLRERTLATALRRLNINIDLSTNQTELVAFFDILTNILLARIVNLLYKA